MIGQERGLPASLAGLFATALQFYARRWPFYLTLLLLALFIQYVVDTQLIAEDYGLMIGLQIVVDAFFAASVSIGVALDIAGRPADWSRIMTAASLRWGVVTFVELAMFFVGWESPNVRTLSRDWTQLFVWIPLVMFSGILTIATVAASIEQVKSRMQLPVIAIGKAFYVSAQFVNIGRLFVLSALFLIPGLLEELVFLHVPRSYIDADFLAQVPIDAIALGPLQAIATVFYIDFLRRLKR